MVKPSDEEAQEQRPLATVVSQSETEYKALISYFKWLVGATFAAITILAAVGGFFFYRSVADVRSDIRVTVDAQAKLLDAQLAQIRDQAHAAALAEARARVDQAFQATNITSMIQEATRRQVGRTIEQEVQDEVDRAFDSIRRQVDSMGEMGDLATKTRIGLREGLEKLSALAKNSPNEVTRQRARLLLDTISVDYERFELEQIKDAGVTPEQWFGPSEGEGSGRIPVIVQTIRGVRQLSVVANAFMQLRYATGYPFRMFDLEQVEKWCRENKPRCDQK